jgi:hypothetical protein
MAIRRTGPHQAAARNNFAFAAWTGFCGDAAAAVQLFRELLPDHERVLGSDHPTQGE